MFSIPMRMRFRGITVREGMLHPRRRPAGASGAPSWSTTPARPPAWLRCAEEAAAGDWPEPVRDRVPVNVTVPALAPERGARAGGPRRAAGPPRSRWPTRRAPSPTTRPGSRRCATRSARAAGSAWTPTGPGTSTPPSRRSQVLERAAGGLEYVEQPCATVEELAAVRRRRRRPRRRRRVDPTGGRPLPGARPRGRRHRRAQGAAARRGARLPADRRGHRAAGRRVVGPGDVGRHRRGGRAGGGAARAGVRLRPRHRAAAGRRRRRPAAAARRRVCCRCGVPRSTDGARSRGCAAAPEPSRALGGPAGRGPRGAARIGPRDAPPSWPAPSSGAGRGRASPRSWSRPGSRNAPLSFAAYDAAAAGLVRLHTRIDERTAGFLALGLTKVGSQRRGDLHVRHRGRQPAPGRARGRARRRPAASS